MRWVGPVRAAFLEDAYILPDYGDDAFNKTFDHLTFSNGFSVLSYGSVDDLEVPSAFLDIVQFIQCQGAPQPNVAHVITLCLLWMTRFFEGHQRAGPSPVSFEPDSNKRVFDFTFLSHSSQTFCGNLLNGLDKVLSPNTLAETPLIDAEAFFVVLFCSFCFIMVSEKWQQLYLVSVSNRS